MNKPKAKGTRREVIVRDAALSRNMGARRSENNLAGRDVDVYADVLRVIEVKDRQQLNVHKTLANTLKRWPEQRGAVVWHRTSKKAGAARSTPDGPTIAATTLDDFMDLLAIAKAAADVAELIDEDFDSVEIDRLVTALRRTGWDFK